METILSAIETAIEAMAQPEMHTSPVEWQRLLANVIAECTQMEVAAYGAGFRNGYIAGVNNPPRGDIVATILSEREATTFATDLRGKK